MFGVWKFLGPETFDAVALLQPPGLACHSQDSYVKTAEPGRTGRHFARSDSSFLVPESQPVHPPIPSTWEKLSLSLAFNSLLPSTWVPDNCCPVHSKLLVWNHCLLLRQLWILLIRRNVILTSFLFQRKQVKFFQQLNPLLCFLLQLGQEDSEEDSREMVKIQNWNIWIRTYIKNTYYFQLTNRIDNFIK